MIEVEEAGRPMGGQSGGLVRVGGQLQLGDAASLPPQRQEGGVGSPGFQSSAEVGRAQLCHSEPQFPSCKKGKKTPPSSEVV